MGSPSSSDSYLTLMEQIHVMVVDHEPEELLSTANMLELCQYRVTIVELASAGITTLMNGSQKFDIILMDINSPDLHGFKLVEQATNMGIPVIVMSDAANALIASRALQNGALLCIKKPTTMDVLSFLWQCVLKKKINENLRTECREIEPNANNVASGEFNMVAVKNNKGKKKMKGRKHNNTNEEREEHLENQEILKNNDDNNKKRPVTEWTQELHEKFVAAVETLGEGKCFPKEILDLMDVPGLTRMQVASHLQKCRNNNWRPPELRKPPPMPEPENVQAASGDGAQGKSRRFGSMPRLKKPAPAYGHVQLIQLARPENAVPVMTLAPNYGGSSSNPPPLSEDHSFFSFQDMDCCLVQGLPGLQLAAPPSAPPAGYSYQHFDPQIYQNAGGAAQWEASGSFGNDDPAAAGNHGGH
ncbi:two-component response regulator ORR26-like [Andrographis paniculata]|uniref:two-component response regulator ORR26-like n=1 Tax=Andrographis paniculata TaxID=175694 RepID=UPI0021E96113|nr:two-component response regulator ORR26-like [Andrographis paniculata]